MGCSITIHIYTHVYTYIYMYTHLYMGIRRHIFLGVVSLWLCRGSPPCARQVSVLYLRALGELPRHSQSLTVPKQVCRLPKSFPTILRTHIPPNQVCQSWRIRCYSVILYFHGGVVPQDRDPGESNAVPYLVVAHPYAIMVLTSPPCPFLSFPMILI